MNTLADTLRDMHKLHRCYLRKITVSFIRLALDTHDIGRRKALKKLKDCRRVTNEDRSLDESRFSAQDESGESVSSE
jgi:hypothetical protein